MNAPIHAAKSPFILAHLPNRRKKAGIAYAEGERTSEQALSGSWNCQYIVIDPEFAVSDSGKKLCSLAISKNCPIVYANTKGLEKLTACENPPPVGVLVKQPSIDFKDLEKIPSPLLILDRLKDPGNVGTLIRTAAAFGYTVILTEGSVSLANEKMIRSTAGMCFLKDILFDGGPAEELAKFLRSKNVLTIGFDPHTPQTPEQLKVDQQRPLALVMGSEVSGLDLTVWPLEHAVRLPIRDGVESLNVAICGAIAMYEFSRRS